MNYLAHALLSGNNESILFGNFIGDAVKGKDYKKYPKEIQNGILLHRFIDSFTDSHPLCIESKRRFYKDFPKLSGIIVDILYDHLLCEEWQKHVETNRAEFMQNTYLKLDGLVNKMPNKMQFLYQHMRTNDWFKRYTSTKGTALSLKQIGNRMGFHQNLGTAIENYKKDEDLFKEEFNVFFVEIKNKTLGFLQTTS